MNKPVATEPTAYSSFWPVILPGLALAIFLGWQVIAGVGQHLNGIRLEEQQSLLAEQASRAARELQTLMMEVLELANTDPSAAAIMKKYNVKYNPAPGESPRPELGPAFDRMQPSPPQEPDNSRSGPAESKGNNPDRL